MRPAAALRIELVADIAKFEKDIGRSAKILRKSGQQFQRMGADLTKALALPVAGIGIALAKAQNQVGGAFETIRAGTGKTGAALDGLKKDFAAVAKSVPNDLQQVGTAIANLATRTGQAGVPLQALATQFLNLSRLTKTDVGENVRQVTRLFGDWSVSTAKQTETMDYLFRASQETGASVQRIAEKVVFAGTTLRAFGFDIQTATAMIAGFEKAGVNTEIVLSSLRQGLARMAKAGIQDVAGAFRVLVQEIKTLPETGAAVAKAIEVFGAKAGPDMALAIREGRLELDALIDAIANGKDTINAAAADSEQFSEVWGRVRNSVLLALEPLGTALLQALQNLMPAILAAIEALTLAVTAFTELPVAVQATVAAFAALAAAIGPLLYAWGALKTAWASTLLLGKQFSAVIVAMTSPVQGLTAAIASLKTALLAPASLISGLGAAVAVVGSAFYLAAQHSESFRRGCVEVAKVVADLKTKVVGTNGVLATFVQNFVKWRDWRLYQFAKRAGREEEAQAILEKHLKTEKALAEQMGKTGDAAGELAKQTEDAAAKAKELEAGIRSDLQGELAKLDKGAKKAAEETKKLAEEWAKFKRDTLADINVDSFGDALTDAMKGTDQAAFENALNAYAEAMKAKTAQGLIDGYKIAKEEAENFAEVVVGKELKDKTTEWAEHLKDKAVEAHKEHADYFLGFMEDAISGTRFDFESQMKKAIASIAAHWLAYMLEGNMGIVQSFVASLGQVLGPLANSFGMGSLFSTAATSAGGAVTGAGGVSAAGGFLSSAGTVGFSAAFSNALMDAPINAVGSAMTASGEAGYMLADGTIVPASTGTFGTMLPLVGGALGGYNLVSNWGNLSAGEGAMSGFGVGAAAGSILPGLGTLVGGIVGGVAGAIAGAVDQMFGDDKSWQEELRQDIRKKLKEAGVLDEDGTLQLMGSGGRGSLGESFQGLNLWEGTGTELADQALGLVEPLSLLLSGGDQGYASDSLTNALANMVAGFGKLSTEAENFNEVFVNVLGLMDRMGVTAQQGKDQMRQLFLDGKISMEQFGASIQAFNLLAQDNLVGTGSVNDALQIVANNLGPNGSPQAALKGLMFAFKEASELGTDQLGIVLQYISETWGPEAAAVFEENIRQAGVQSFEDFNNLSAEQVFELFEAMAEFGDGATEVLADVEEGFHDSTVAVGHYSESLHNIPAVVRTKIVREYEEKGNGGGGESGGGEPPERGARGAIFGLRMGGVLTGPRIWTSSNGRLFELGEAGPEGVLPLARTSHGLGVYATGSGGSSVNVVYNIDARGASPGVETKIMQAIRASENRAVIRSVKAVGAAMR
jgi:TP901 family phage tail tape measure protein